MLRLLGYGVAAAAVGAVVAATAIGLDALCHTWARYELEEHELRHHRPRPYEGAVGWMR
jgi:hypothetical protein